MCQAQFRLGLGGYLFAQKPAVARYPIVHLCLPYIKPSNKYGMHTQLEIHVSLPFWGGWVEVGGWVGVWRASGLG